MREPVGHRVYDVNKLHILILIHEFLAFGVREDWPCMVRIKRQLIQAPLPRDTTRELESLGQTIQREAVIVLIKTQPSARLTGDLILRKKTYR